MITKTQVMESLIGKPVVDAMVETLYNQNEDFPAIYQAYLDAIERLHTVLGPEAKHNIRKYTVAIEQMCASNLYHAGVQGLKMNYDHFVNPMMPNCRGMCITSPGKEAAWSKSILLILSL